MWYCDAIEPPQLIKEEEHIKAEEALRTCIDLLCAVYGDEEIKKVFKEFDIDDYR